MKPEVRNICAGKTGNITSHIKPVLSDQLHRLQDKNHYDVDLIEDMRTFIKVKCNIEKDYAQALIKLTNSHHQKKYPTFTSENDSDLK